MRIRRTIAVLGVVAAALASLVAPGVLFADDAPTVIDIQIAPSTINLGYEGKSVTVHADLAYAVASKFDWELNGVASYFTFADDCGDLVAKFHVGEIAKVVELGDVTMTLTGEDGSVVIYEGTDDVRVIDQTPTMKNR